MGSGEKGVEREAKKQGVMVKKLKGGMWVGKRGGPCTPPPTWRLEFPSCQNDDSPTNVQEFLTFPNSTTTSISARKLCANLWEIQPHQHLRRPLTKMRKGGARPRLHRHHCRGKGFEASKHFVDPHSPPDTPATASSLRRHVAASLVQHHRSVGRNDFALQPLSPASHGNSLEVGPYNPAVSPSSSLELKARMGESSYGLKTSTELVKVLNRIWSLEEQHASNISLLRALKMELHHSKAQIKELLEEKQSDRLELDGLMKLVTEDKLSRKNKEQDRIKAVVESMRDELEDERKLRKRSESLHRKLAREVSELKSSFSNALRELERERKARVLLENLCDEFAKGIRDYEQEVRSLKHKNDKDRVGKDNNDRLIVHISEAWLDERMQMRLAEARNDIAEKNTIVDKLGFDIENFLQAKRSIDSRRGENLSPQELVKNCSCRNSLESLPLNETVSAPQNAADEEVSSGGDSNCFEQIKSTGGKQSKGNFQQKGETAAEGHQKEMVKSNSTGAKVALWEVDDICQPSSLHDQFKEYMGHVTAFEGNASQFSERQQGVTGGEMQGLLNYPNASGIFDATQEGLQERNSKRVGTFTSKSNRKADNLVKNQALSREADKVHPQSSCGEESCERSVLTGNASPVQLWTLKSTTPGFEKSGSSLRLPRGMKENTLMAKLIEARIERQQSRLKVCEDCF